MEYPHPLTPSPLRRGRWEPDLAPRERGGGASPVPPRPFLGGEGLSEGDLAACFAIREAVFVREQGVPAELELDEYDETATHLLWRREDGEPVATLRILDKGDRVGKIGRVAVVASERGKGVGLALMQAALGLLTERGFTTAVLEAQVSVIGFYERLGFVAEGEEFMDAGIAHRRMRKSL